MSCNRSKSLQNTDDWEGPHLTSLCNYFTTTTTTSTQYMLTTYSLHVCLSVCICLLFYYVSISVHYFPLPVSQQPFIWLQYCSVRLSVHSISSIYVFSILHLQLCRLVFGKLKIAYLHAEEEGNTAFSPSPLLLQGDSGNVACQHHTIIYLFRI